MLSTDLASLDSGFIAKHVLERLNLPVDSSRLTKIRLPINSDVKSAIQAIEKIENSWEYQAPTNSHTFGRKTPDETIRLWSIPSKSAEVLRDIVILTGAKNILEIGTSAGYSTLYLADGAKHTHGCVSTIELLSEKAKLARQFFIQSKLDNIKLIEAEAKQVLLNWSAEPIDLVFLDADKENYALYLRLLIPLLKKGAIIIADNINDYGHLMEDYLQLVTGTHLPKSRADKRVSSYYLAALDNGLMFTKKI